MSKMIDITGRRFGRLTVIGIHDNDGVRIRWSCKCDCGNIIPCYKSTLTRNDETIKSCGCVYADELRTHIGERKDCLEIVGVEQIGRKARVVGRCDCGKEQLLKYSQFKNPEVHSCGCIGARKGTEHNKFIHGLSHTRIYNVHSNMISRCRNEKDISYRNYGAKGIKVCQEWHDFLVFREWSYANGYNENASRGRCTLDRIDPNGDYCPENCRWVDMNIQSNNKTNNKCYTINGETKTLSEWCNQYNLCVQSVYGRLKRGMDIEAALTKPMRKNKKQYDTSGV